MYLVLQLPKLGFDTIFHSYMSVDVPPLNWQAYGNNNPTYLI